MNVAVPKSSCCIDTLGGQAEGIGKKALEGFLGRKVFLVFINATGNQGYTENCEEGKEEKTFSLKKELKHFSRKRASVKGDVF